MKKIPTIIPVNWQQWLTDDNNIKPPLKIDLTKNTLGKKVEYKIILVHLKPTILQKF